MSSRLQVEIRESPISSPERPHWTAIVTTSKERCYCAIYAGDKPSEDKVRRDWQEDGGSKSKNWRPYVS